MEGIRRGHLKFYVLKLLLREQFTGYGLMKRIKEETGFWKPSTGSLYPLLDAMKGQGLITNTEEPGGGKRWAITPKGRSAYSEATDIKETLFENMRNSMLVFAKVFGRDDLEEIVKRLEQWKIEREDLVEVAGIFMEIHDALWSLPRLTPKERDRILEILKTTRDQLGAFGKQSDINK
ncbi:MAG TPA: PadR family transcriptional regulator [Candidatus Acetothermia bacterium]|nr:PadR family transcriptional regulator [Candidatus Acetothermia bacterium]